MEDYVKAAEHAAEAFRRNRQQRRAELGAIVDRAIAETGVELIVLVKLSIVCRDVYIFDLADRCARAALERDPDHPFAWYELAFSLRLQGRHREALEAVEELLKRRPTEARVFALKAHLAILVGDKETAAAALEWLEASGYDSEAIQIYREFQSFIRDYPAARAQEYCHQRETSGRYAHAPEIAARARAALASRTGFSLLRMGDGEGAFVYLSEADEARFPAMYAWNRRDRAEVWFGRGVDLEKMGFAALARDFKAVVSRADVLGIPYATWMEHEYRIGSITGISTLINLFRMYEQPDVDAGQAFCRQDAHLKLHEANLYAEIFADVSEIGLISCHPHIAAYIKQKFGVKQIEFFKIPGEKLFEHIIGAAAVDGVHFPDRYDEIVAELGSRDLGGRLFLVAGGFLGKYYCDLIKRQNGVALDVGSIVDEWLGLDTRPMWDV